MGTYDNADGSPRNDPALEGGAEPMPKTGIIMVYYDEWLMRDIEVYRCPHCYNVQYAYAGADFDCPCTVIDPWEEEP